MNEWAVLNYWGRAPGLPPVYAYDVYGFVLPLLVERCCENCAVYVSGI